MRDKICVEDDKMSAAYIATSKAMAEALLTREFKGPGDTLDAAAHRLQRRFGVPASILKRLRHRDVKDMLMSNFILLVKAYETATARMEAAYEHEKKMAVDPRILRLAALVAGEDIEKEKAP